MYAHSSCLSRCLCRGGVSRGEKRVFPRSYPHVFPNKNEKRKEEKIVMPQILPTQKGGETHRNRKGGRGVFRRRIFSRKCSFGEKKSRKCNYESPFSAALHSSISDAHRWRGKRFLHPPSVFPFLLSCHLFLLLASASYSLAPCRREGEREKYSLAGQFL